MEKQKDVPFAPARTELIWDGKYQDGKRVAPLRVALPFQTVETVNESVQERQKNLLLEAPGVYATKEWRNRLIWGDKKYVLPSLLAEFAGKVNLIYIDPPFDTGADFSFTATVPDHPDEDEDNSVAFTKEPSIIEQKAYRDTWGVSPEDRARGASHVDRYLKWFYENVVLLHELLHETGSIYVHIGPNVNHLARAVLDEVFGRENHLNEIIWRRAFAHSDSNRCGIIHDAILLYVKSQRWTWNTVRQEPDPEYIDMFFDQVDQKTGKRYQRVTLTGPGITKEGESGKPWRGIDPSAIGRHWASSHAELDRLDREGRIHWPKNGVPRLKRFEDEYEGMVIQDIWTDINKIHNQAIEATGYPTQKPETLLQRILNASSNRGDLVLDCFCGSGTTAAVAEKLGRRWIACDLGRFAIHTTRKRLLSISAVRPFVVQNLGKYERQLWAGVEFGEGNGKQAATRQRAYVEFILKLYNAKPIQGYMWLHGLHGGRMVHVGSVDGPVTAGDVTQMAVEFKKAIGKGADAPKTNGIDVLGWDFAFELNEVSKQQAAAANIQIRFIKIPRDVMDTRAVEQGDVKFFELAALAVKAEVKKQEVKLRLTDFVIPPDDVPEDVRKAVKHWSQWIDYWAVDWNHKGDTFHNEWQTYRTRKEPKLELETTHAYAEKGEYSVVAKVIDILGNDTTKTVKVKVKSNAPEVKPGKAQLALLEAKVSTAPCVPAIREKVKAWAAGAKYAGVTDTTRLLLNYWFHTDHRSPNGRKFKYEYFQREAMETLVYLYEVAKARSHKALVEGFATHSDLRLLQNDLFARYCVKMATGSGKTKVMSLAVAWQFFNAVNEGREDFAKTFLVIAPNVIVFERLRTDFGEGRIFRQDPVIPPELEIFGRDVQCYMRGEGERASSIGALYLTNVQQFYERAGKGDDEPDEMTAVLGPKPPTDKQMIEDFDKRIAQRGGPVMVLNDEAHHTHDEDSEWNKTIRTLHGGVSHGLAAQLDFTATPRHTKGQLFSWTVYDYPLKQAIIDNMVKRPLKGIATGITEQPSKIASTRYQAYLTAGVERWKEYREQLKTYGKKPVPFVMMNETADADDVADWLQKKYPSEFGGDKLVTIHTKKSGEVSEADLDTARKLSREVDDEKSPTNCIVSVLMLREGWDVQGVTVIVGLRPYTAKANILPEQTVGRGLRLMFRGTGSGYVEHVDVIGNKKFIEFVEDLEHEEGMEFGTFEVGKDKVVIVNIAPDPKKADKDISLPVLSPILTRKKSLAEEITALDVMKFACPVLPRKQSDKAAQQFHYEGYDIISQEKMLERDYTIPEPQTAEEVIGYYARRIAQDVKLPSQFAALVPKVREFLENKAFGETVNLQEPGMVKAISSNVAVYMTVKLFDDALKKLVVEELLPQLLNRWPPSVGYTAVPMVTPDVRSAEVHL